MRKGGEIKKKEERRKKLQRIKRFVAGGIIGNLGNTSTKSAEGYLDPDKVVVSSLVYWLLIKHLC